jgi:C1A family cysteine protease
MAMPVRKHQWYGCNPDHLDARDLIFKPKIVRLPLTGDLRKHCPPIMNQGPLGSCTAHGISGPARYLLLAKNKPDIMLARLQLYFDERKSEGSIDSDAGAEIRDGIKCLAKIGIAHETLWPYKVANFKKQPPATVYRDAAKFKALTYERVAVDANYIRMAIAQGFPVIIGIAVYDGFETDYAARTGIIPMPAGAPIGGHCMYVVGYGQKKGYFTVRNSWGADWGDKGDCYIPYGYLGSTQYGSDYWIIKSLTV